MGLFWVRGSSGYCLKVTKDNIENSTEFCLSTVGRVQVNRLQNLDYRGPVYIGVGP